MKARPRIRVLHAHAWMATKLIDAYASYTRTRGLKHSQTTRTRGCICAPDTKLAQLWHNSRENGWALGAAHRRARAHQAHVWMVPS